METKKKIILALLAILVFSPLSALNYSVRSISIDKKVINYNICVTNNSNKQILLTDINGTYYTFRDGVLYIELFAHDEIWEHPQMAESYQFSSDYFCLEPGKSLIIKRKFKLDKLIKNNFVESDKSLLNFDVKNIEFLIGYSEDIEPKLKGSISYPDLFKNQSILGIYVRKRLETFDYEMMRNYLCTNLAYRGPEIEKQWILENFVKSHSDKIPEFLKKIIKEYDFIDSMNNRIYVLDMAASLIQIFNLSHDAKKTPHQLLLIKECEDLLFKKIYSAAKNGNILLTDFVSLNSKFGNSIQLYCTEYNKYITEEDQKIIESYNPEYTKEYSFYVFVGKLIN